MLFKPVVGLASFFLVAAGVRDAPSIQRHTVMTMYLVVSPSLVLSNIRDGLAGGEEGKGAFNAGHMEC